MNQYKRLGKNVGAMVIGNFVIKILSFFMVPFYMSILSTSEYGTADLITTTITLILPVFSLLMDEAVMRFSLDKGNSSKQIFTTALKISTIGFGIAMICSPIILLFDMLRPYYWHFVIYYVSVWFYNLSASYAKGQDKVVVLTIGGLIHSVLYISINIITLLFLKWRVHGYLLAISGSNLLTVLFFWGYFKFHKQIEFGERLDKNLARSMVRYSTPLIPNYMAWWVNNAADRYILAAFSGSGVTGIYAAAFKIPTLLSSITSLFASAWKISAVDEFGSEKSIKFYNNVYGLYNSFLFISGAGLIFLTQIFARLLYAKDFFIAWRITPILIFSYILSAQCLFLESIFTSSKKTKILFLASLVGAFVNVGLNLLLIPKYEGTGAAIATVIGYFVILCITIFCARKILSMNFYLIKNSICYILLIVEIFLTLINTVWSYGLAAVLVCAIILINIKELIALIRKFLNKRKVKMEAEIEANK